MLVTSSEVIDALGGTAALTGLLGVGPSAISNYRKNGFPARAALILARQCEQRGLAVASDVFGVALPNPDEKWRRQSATGTTKDQLTALIEAGFTPCETTILQPADPFIDLLGEEMRRRLFSFTDPRGESLCLRPDLTIPTAQAYLETVGSAASSQRLCYQGTAFRYQPRGAGKPEEFTQLGFEILNGAEPLNEEIEVFCLTIDLLTDLGVTEFEVFVNDLALFEAALNDLELTPRQVARLNRAYAHGGSLETTLKALQKTPESKARSLPADAPAVIIGRDRDEILARFEDKENAAQATPLTAEMADTILNLSKVACSAMALEQTLKRQGLVIGDALAAQLAQYEKRMTALQQKFTSRPANFAANRGRKLAYYTGFVFEIIVPSLGPRQTIASGGRYDALLSALGATKPMPAIGAALALERVTEAGAKL